jgi:hypothetical protein
MSRRKSLFRKRDLHAQLGSELRFHTDNLLNGILGRVILALASSSSRHWIYTSENYVVRTFKDSTSPT